MWIFLDIDGVLVPEKQFDNYLSTEDILKFNPTCLNEFENVLRCYPEVRVVISSSWREVFSFEVVRPLFSPDIAERVVGFTPFLDSKIIHQFQYLRHQEVLAFSPEAPRHTCTQGKRGMDRRVAVGTEATNQSGES